MSIDHDASLAELVVAQPQAAAVLERLRLDYCCGGATTLTDACARRGLDADTVAALLDALDDGSPEADRLAAHDVGRASISELCDHIVVAHHGPLRPALDRIDHLLATVVRVHGETQRSLYDVDRLFAALRADLEAHMHVEESRLFPACRTLAASGDADAFGDGLLALLEDDHAATGDAMHAIRELTGDFDEGHARCSTHRQLLAELRAFELDLHQHIHEENNILFPRVRERLPTKEAATGSIPRREGT
jgi:regulator of cell morphogenesis and NO signaling